MCSKMCETQGSCFITIWKSVGHKSSQSTHRVIEFGAGSKAETVLRTRNRPKCSPAFFFRSHAVDNQVTSSPPHTNMFAIPAPLGLFFSRLASGAIPRPLWRSQGAAENVLITFAWSGAHTRDQRTRCSRQSGLWGPRTRGSTHHVSCRPL